MTNDETMEAKAAAKASGPTPAGSGFTEHHETALHENPSGSIDIAGLQAVLDGRWAEHRAKGRAYAAEPFFARPDESILTSDHRELTLERVKELANRGWARVALPEHLGGVNDPGANIAAFEELVAGDPSVQVKAGVQFGLFGSAILNLGTAEHHKTWLDGALSLEIPGVYAMTEIGHGSDVSALGTTATYDPDTEEFIINTPFRAAMKCYLGNAALHGKAAVVFAQLITQGVNHGVHCLFVPIRDDDGNPMEGVTIEDDGHKGGLNGIDNGRLAFDHVRVPRTNLLNKYGDVAPDGTYTSDIESPGRRFFTMLGTLVQGRVSLAGAAIKAAELGLGIAITYGNERRQFADTGGVGEVVLLDYQLHQARLLPLLARTYAAAFAQEEMLGDFHTVFSGEEDTPENREDLETLAAALKPNATWLALDALKESREACGGAGFIAANRLTGLHHDLDIYATFEGDNHVLTQLVGKRLLTDYAKSMKNMDAADMGKFIAGRADVISSRLTSWRGVIQTASDFGNVRRSANSLQDPELQMSLISTRARLLVEELSLALRPAASMPKDKAAKLVNSHQVDLIDAAKAHVDLLLLSSFNRAIDKVSDKATKDVLIRLRDLFALTTIQRELAWYVIEGHLSAGRARTLGDYINRLLAHIRPHAADLVAAFGYTQDHYRAPISSGLEADRQHEAHEYYRRRRASGDAPIDEKVLIARKAEAEKKAKKKR